MASWKDHLAVGFFTVVALAIFLHFFFDTNIFDGHFIVTTVIIVTIFSLLPDIDHKSSRISKCLNVALVVAIIGAFWQTFKFTFSNVLLGLSVLSLWLYYFKFARNDWQHRQFPHTFTFGLLASVVSFFVTFSLVMAVFAFVAFSSHLIADNHTKQAWRMDGKNWRRLILYIKTF